MDALIMEISRELYNEEIKTDEDELLDDLVKKKAMEKDKRGKARAGDDKAD